MTLQGTRCNLVLDQLSSIVAMTKKDEQIHVLKSYVEGTKQASKEDKSYAGYIQPPILFSTLTKTVEYSFIIGWIIDKISSWCATWFESVISDPKAPTAEEKKLDALLESINLKFAFQNICTYGNIFFEKIKNGAGKIFVDPIITETVRIKKEKKDNSNDRIIKYYQVVWSEKVSFEQDEIIHIKNLSLSNKYYGDSIFSNCVDQIVLLAAIDKYYKNLFERGNLNVQIIIDKDNKLTEQKREALQVLIQDMVKWVDRAFSTLVVPAWLETLKLENDSDTKAFLEYRKDLIKSLAIGMNIPYDLLISDNSNRSTSEVAVEQLNKDIAKPLQKMFVQQLRRQLESEFPSLIDRINLKEPDTKNQKEEMEVQTWYVKGWVLKPNEVRELLWYEPDPEWDRLVMPNPKDSTVEQVTKSIEKFYQPLYKSRNVQVTQG